MIDLTVVLIVVIILLLGLSLYLYLLLLKMRKAKIECEQKSQERLDLLHNQFSQERAFDEMRKNIVLLFIQKLQSPLLSLVEPLKEVSQRSTLPSGFPNLHAAYRDSIVALDACTQLLQVYKQRSSFDNIHNLIVSNYYISNLADDVTSSVSELIRVNHIDFHYTKYLRPDLTVWVDSKLMSVVFHNLLSNAFNHVHFSGTVSLSLSESIGDENSSCLITIYDNGKKKVHPIRELVADNLEEDLSIMELGYEVMERIVSLHHGTLSMKSDEESGTQVIINLPTSKQELEKDKNITFRPITSSVTEITHSKSGEQQPTVVLPVSPIAENQPSDTLFPDPATNTKTDAKGKHTLLIIEEHKEILLYLKVLLADKYNILTALTGQDGVEMALRELPDLILCNVSISDKSGFECCKEIKDDPTTCHIPFILLTAKAEDEDIVRGLEMGADDYMLKPFTPSILQAKIRSLIGNRAVLKQTYTKLLSLLGTDDEISKDKESAKDVFISTLVNIIEENISEPDFNVTKLASSMNMSQPTLYRKVKQVANCTIIELITGVRIRRAGMLLRQNRYSVQEVAEMVGYNDISTFRKRFVEIFGTTPSIYAASAKEQ